MPKALITTVKWTTGVFACVTLATGCLAASESEERPETVGVTEQATTYNYCPSPMDSDENLQKASHRKARQIKEYIAGASYLPPDKYGTPAHQSGNCSAVIGDLNRMREHTRGWKYGLGDAPGSHTICGRATGITRFRVTNDAAGVQKLDEIVPVGNLAGWSVGDRFANHLIGCWGKYTTAFVLPKTALVTQTETVRRKVCERTFCRPAEGCEPALDCYFVDETNSFLSLEIDPEIAQTTSGWSSSSNGAVASAFYTSTGDGTQAVKWVNYYMYSSTLSAGKPCFTYFASIGAQTTKHLVESSAGSKYFACL